MRSLVLAAVGAAALTLAAASTASAHPPGGPQPGYYGNGNHDAQPHWHKTYTPHGPTMWYGERPARLPAARPLGHPVGRGP